MALNVKDMVQLSKTVLNADAKAPVAYSFGDEKFSYTDLADTLRNEFAALAGTYALYRENKNTIFSIIEQTIDDILPKRVLEQYGSFAEIKTFKQGEHPLFVQKITTASKRRARQFIGKVGLAGLYEVFKLDKKSYEVSTDAIGGAAQIGFEEYLDGRVDFADVLDIVLEGIDSCVYVEIEKQLFGAINNVQATNKTSQAGFIAAEFDKLLTIADSYGTKADIYCTFDFAAKMVPEEGWVSDELRNERWNNGYIARYKGHRVIVLNQSFEDETNTVKVIDPGYAWIIPSSSNKPVKIAFEGSSIVDEYVNYDRSREIQIYQKVGVRAIISNDICVYHDTSLTR